MLIVPFHIIQQPHFDYYENDKKIIDSTDKKSNINDEFNNNKESADSSSARSTPGIELKIDPHYSWILKDLNLNDKKRVIDVTDLIEKEENKKKEEDEEETIQEEKGQMLNNNNNNENQTTEVSNKNETSQDVLTSLIHDPSNDNNNKFNNDNTEGDEDEDDDDDDDDDNKLLEEQLTNILSTQHNPNYESIDVNNIYFSNDYEENDEDSEEEEEEGEVDKNNKNKFLKTATFKLLSPFNAELFSESDSDTDTELKEAKVGVNSEVMTDDTESDDDNDDNIKNLQKKYQKIIEDTLKNSDDDDDDDDDQKNENKKAFKSRIPTLLNNSAKAKFQPKKVENEEKLIKNSCFNNKNNIDENNGNFKKFSKSFEISLSDLDDRIGRLNNEIKLKRGNANTKDEPAKNVKEVMTPNQKNNEEMIINKENIELKKTSEKTLNSTYNLSEPTISSSNMPNLVCTSEKEAPITNVNKMKPVTKIVEPTSVTSTPTSTGLGSPNKSQVDLLQQEQKRQQQIHVNMIETMKKEWSQVLDKLQLDYKIKLEEQQQKHEDQLKTLYEEIKKSIIVENSKPSVNSSQQSQHVESLDLNKISSEPNSGRLENYSSSNLPFSDDSMAFKPESIKKNKGTIEDLINQIDINQMEKNDYLNNVKNLNRSISNDSNYVSNLRLSLKTKHSRHIQDLKSYYEQEIEELKRELQKAQTKYSHISGSQYLTSTAVNTPRLQTPRNAIVEEVSDLKNQNLANLKKLVRTI